MAIGNMRNPTLNQLRLAWYQKVNHNGIPKRAESKKYIDGYFARGVVVNVAPSLVVTLTGTGTVGSAITVAVSGLGTPPAVPTYQWQKNGSNIVGATTTSYTPVVGDVGATINCRVSATNVAGTDAKTAGTGVLISAGPTAPSITVVITGSAPIGSVLTAVPTIVAGNPTPTFSYQWKRGGANISGATAVNYTTVSGDVASAITCTVVGTNPSGSDTKTSSNSITVTQVPTITVAITGLAPAGSVLTATPTLVSGSPAPSYAYEWQKNGTPIGGATASTYTTVTGDIGGTVNCRITATNSAGSDAQLGSVGVVVVTPGSVPTGISVTISPTAGQSGQVFTANATATGATSYTYKWQDNGVDIAGATAQTYASDGTWGTMNLNCLVTPVNANGNGTAGKATIDALMRWGGYIALDGSGLTTAQTIDSLRVMNGQQYHLLSIGVTPAGNITVEGVGPTALTSHTYYKGQTVNVLTTMDWALATADQVFNFLQSSNWGGSIKYLFKTVGYGLTPVMTSGGIAGSDANPTTVNCNVPANGLIMAVGKVYDGVPNPTGIQHFSGSTFQKASGAAFSVAGCGYLTSANAALGVQFTKASGAATAKGGAVVVLAPLNPPAQVYNDENGEAPTLILDMHNGYYARNSGSGLQSLDLPSILTNSIVPVVGLDGVTRMPISVGTIVSDGPRVATLSNISFNTLAGTILTKYRTGDVGAFGRVFSLYANGANAFDVYVEADNDIKFNVVVASANQAYLGVTKHVDDRPESICAAWAVGDFAFCIGGQAVDTVASGTLPAVTTLCLGCIAGGSPLVGAIESLIYWPKRLTNASIKTLSGSGLRPIVDIVARSSSAFTMPGYLAEAYDPVFGTKLTRISNNGAAIPVVGGVWKNPSRPVYPGVSAWNRDESLLYLEHGKVGQLLFLNGETYDPLYSYNSPSGLWDTRWSPVDPSIMYYVTNTCQFRSWNVLTNTTNLLRDFGATYITGSMQICGGSADLSNNGDIVSLDARRTSDSHYISIIYRLSDDTIIGTIDATALGKVLAEGHTTISPDGDYVHIYFDDETSAIFPAAGNHTSFGTATYQITATQMPSHGDTIKYAGNQYYVGASRGTGTPAGGDMIRRLMSANTVATITGDSYAYHTSARNWRAGDWCLANYFNDSGVPYVGELVAEKLDASRNYRICHHRSTASPYEAEPHAVLSPTGKRALFGTDWGTAGGPVHAFVVDFRNFLLTP